MSNFNRKPLDREAILQKVVAIPFSGCWIWMGWTTSGGYGLIARRIDEGDQETRYLAHRAAYALFVGPIPDGMNVLHRCDITHCVNPAHLYLGTQLDNVRDIYARGRSGARKRSGALNGRAKLTPEQVEFVRQATHISGYRLARQLGVDHSQIYRIRNGHSWTVEARHAE